MLATINRLLSLVDALHRLRDETLKAAQLKVLVAYVRAVRAAHLLYLIALALIVSTLIAVISFLRLLDLTLIYGIREVFLQPASYVYLTLLVLSGTVLGYSISERRWMNIFKLRQILLTLDLIYRKDVTKRLETASVERPRLRRVDQSYITVQNPTDHHTKKQNHP